MKENGLKKKQVGYQKKGKEVRRWKKRQKGLRERERERERDADPHRGNRLVEAKVKYQRSSLRLKAWAELLSTLSWRYLFRHFAVVQ